MSIAWLLYKGDKITRQNTHMLDRLQHHLNISSLREADFREEMEGLNAYVGDINSAMKKDRYKSVSEQNKVLDKISKNLNNLNNVVSKEQGNSIDEFGKVKQDIQILKNTLDALRNDPNMISRY
ncbi:MAG: hypothetical protein GY907_07730 [Bacteroidetes bacterium]|nr:hypothetical protein [Bacteroidota bacterium]